MTAFERKSIFIWQPAAIGNPARIVELLKAARFETAILHAHNLPVFRSLHSRALADALKAAGLGVIGSVAVYGVDPAAEGRQSAAYRKEYGLDGWIFDAEGGFDSKPKPNTNAVKLMQAFKAGDPNTLTAWCSWARFWSPTLGEIARWHPVDVMRAAMEYCDYGMPMMYWTDGSAPANAIRLLDQSIPQWQKYTKKPLIPIGRAYHGDWPKNTNYTVTPEAVREFAAQVRGRGFKGVSWWSMQHAVALPTIWQALTETVGYRPAPVTQPEPPVVVESQLDRIERKLDELLEMAKL